MLVQIRGFMNINEIKLLMDELGWSQRELARRAGLHYNTVHYMLSGRKGKRSGVTLDTFQKCIDAIEKGIGGY